MRFRSHKRRRPLCASVSLCVALVLAPSYTPAVPAQHEVSARGPVQSQCHFYRDNPRFDTCHHGLIADAAVIELLNDPSKGVILVDTSATVDEKPGVEVRRAQNAWGYLVTEKGVPPDRVVLRWNRVTRASNKRWGGSMRILVVRSGERLPEFVEDDVAWQLSSP